MNKNTTLIRWQEEPEKTRFLIEYIPGHEESEIKAAFMERFGILLSESQIGNFKHSHNIKSGTNGGRYRKGHIPCNKGERMSKEVYEKCANTMFKKGHMPHNHRNVGSERIDDEGYTMVKVAEPKKWSLKHRILYEEYHNEKLKPSDTIIFLDGDKNNFSEDNLIKMSRSELLRYNRDGLYEQNAPTNLSAVLVAKLKARIGEKRNGVD